MAPRQRRPGRITLADVAREAGVSVQTASHVLAGNETVRIPEATRQRVREAAEKVAYVPNRLAQAMRRGRSHVIGAWMPMDRPSPIFYQFLRHISRETHADGYDLMVTAIDADLAYSAAGRMPYVWPVDGIIAIDAGKAIQKLRENAQFDDIPTSVLGFEQYANSDSVGWDVVGASRQVTEELLLAGCRRIIHLTPNWVLENYPREQRRRGYYDAMADAGYEPVLIGADDEQAPAGQAAITAYLADHPAPQAITCFSDGLAAGAIRALVEAGVSVPAETRVWGFGDSPGLDDQRIPISSIAIPYAQISTQAWAWLRERLANPQLEGRLARIPMPLVHRASSSPS